jgi:hypothetical protein
VGSEPVPKGQQFTYTVRARGRMTSPEEFGNIVVRESPTGAIVRVKDVARVELGAQSYNMVSRLDGKAAAIVAAYLQDIASKPVTSCPGLFPHYPAMPNMFVYRLRVPPLEWMEKLWHFDFCTSPLF